MCGCTTMFTKELKAGYGYFLSSVFNNRTRLIAVGGEAVSGMKQKKTRICHITRI